MAKEIKTKKNVVLGLSTDNSRKEWNAPVRRISNRELKILREKGVTSARIYAEKR